MVRRLLPDRSLGARGERLAERYLRRAGYRTLHRNLRTRIGEVDRVMLTRDRRTIVFVEVKARTVASDRPQPPPHAAITAHKRRKLLTLAETISLARGWTDRPKRIDVVSVEFPRTGKPIIRHFPDAVRG